MCLGFVFWFDIFCTWIWYIALALPQKIHFYWPWLSLFYIWHIISRYPKKDRQYNGQKKKMTKGQTKIYKTLHRKLKIEQHEHHWKPAVNWGVPEGLAVPDPHETPVLILLNDMNIILHRFMTYDYQLWHHQTFHL
jgi:hypothetical protein